MPNHGGNLQHHHSEQSMKHSSYKKEIEIEKKRKRKKEMRKEEREKKKAPFSHGK